MKIGMKKEKKIEGSPERPLRLAHPTRHPGPPEVRHCTPPKRKKETRRD
jgi:hypothetical protein